LGEFLALSVSLEDLGSKTGNDKVLVLAEALDQATSKLLDTNKSPSRKVNELDNRGSHFYLALYWAQALAAQSKNLELRDQFVDFAQELADSETKIVDELNSAQGRAMDLDGYYQPNVEKATGAMRPSATFNAALDALVTRS
jgi:isocitrate dehydrogenase